MERGSHSGEVDVRSFVKLLNEKKFCCHLCSCCWFFRRIWNFVPLDLSIQKYSLSKNLQSAALICTVETVSRVSDEQLAYFCVCMLASFFKMRPSAANLHCLKKSICSDIYYGYIRETLAHLKEE